MSRPDSRRASVAIAAGATRRSGISAPVANRRYLRAMAVTSLYAMSPALTQFVSGLHHFEADDRTAPVLERILPGGRVHLMVNLHEDEFRIYEGSDCATVHRSGGAVLEGPT